MNKEEDAMPLVFHYLDYRSFLSKYMDYIKEKNKTSFREISKSLGFRSPNYIQQIINGNRHLSVEKSKEIAGKIFGDEDSRQYFSCLVKLHRYSDKNGVQQKIEKYQKRHLLEISNDSSMFSSWLHGVIWELCSCKLNSFSVDALHQKLKGLASVSDISDSLDFLVKKGFLKPNIDGSFSQKNVSFQFRDDAKRNIDIQRSHQYFCKMASHRLNDDLIDREFQGLTLAIAKKNIPRLKTKIRDFIRNLAEDMSDDNDAENVFRIQVAAFSITSD